jgi:hypothetical protein
MVSACSIFVGGLLSRYTNLSDRIRAMTGERLTLLRQVSANRRNVDCFTAERLREIDAELPDLAHRHRLLHHATLSIYVAILVLVACMAATAVSAMVLADWLMALVLILFMCGVLVLLLGVALVALEVRTSQRALQCEVKRVLNLDYGATQ